MVKWGIQVPVVYLAYFVVDILDLLRFRTRETMGVCVRGRKLYGGGGKTE